MSTPSQLPEELSGAQSSAISEIGSRQDGKQLVSVERGGNKYFLIVQNKEELSGKTDQEIAQLSSSSKTATMMLAWLDENRGAVDDATLQAIRSSFTAKVTASPSGFLSKLFGQRVLHQKVADAAVKPKILAEHEGKFLSHVEIGGVHHLVVSDSQDAGEILKKVRTREGSIAKVRQFLEEHRSILTAPQIGKIERALLEKQTSLTPLKGRLKSESGVKISSWANFRQKLMNWRAGGGFATDHAVATSTLQFIKDGLAERKFVFAESELFSHGSAHVGEDFISVALPNSTTIDAIIAGDRANIDRTQIGSQGTLSTPDSRLAVSSESYGTQKDKEKKDGRNCDRAEVGFLPNGGLGINVADGSGAGPEALLAATTTVAYCRAVQTHSNPFADSSSVEDSQRIGLEMFSRAIHPEFNPLASKSYADLGYSLSAGEATALSVYAEEKEGEVVVSGAAVGDCIAFTLLTDAEGTVTCDELFACDGLQGSNIDESKAISDAFGQLRFNSPDIPNDMNISHMADLQATPEQIVKGIYKKYNSSQNPIIITASDGLSDNLPIEEMREVVKYLALCSDFDQVPERDPPNQFDPKSAPDFTIESEKLKYDVPVGQSVSGKPNIKSLEKMFGVQTGSKLPDNLTIVNRLKNYVAWIAKGLIHMDDKYATLLENKVDMLTTIYPWEKHGITKEEFYQNLEIIRAARKEDSSVSSEVAKDPRKLDGAQLERLTRNFSDDKLTKPEAFKKACEDIKKLGSRFFDRSEFFDTSNIEGVVDDLKQLGADINQPHVKEVLSLHKWYLDRSSGKDGKLDDVTIVAASPKRSGF